MEMYEFDQLSDEAQARAVATVRHALYAEGFDPTEELTMQAHKQFGTNKKVDRAATQIDLQKLYVSILAHNTNFV